MQPIDKRASVDMQSGFEQIRIKHLVLNEKSNSGVNPDQRLSQLKLGPRMSQQKELRVGEGVTSRVNRDFMTKITSLETTFNQENQLSTNPTHKQGSMTYRQFGANQKPLKAKSKDPRYGYKINQLLHDELEILPNMEQLQKLSRQKKLLVDSNNIQTQNFDIDSLSQNLFQSVHQKYQSQISGAFNSMIGGSNSKDESMHNFISPGDKGELLRHNLRDTNFKRGKMTKQEIAGNLKTARETTRITSLEQRDCQNSSNSSRQLFSMPTNHGGVRIFSPTNKELSAIHNQFNQSAEQLNVCRSMQFSSEVKDYLNTSKDYTPMNIIQNQNNDNSKANHQFIDWTSLPQIPKRPQNELKQLLKKDELAEESSVLDPYIWNLSKHRRALTNRIVQKVQGTMPQLNHAQQSQPNLKQKRKTQILREDSTSEQCSRSCNEDSSDSKKEEQPSKQGKIRIFDNRVINMAQMSQKRYSPQKQRIEYIYEVKEGEIGREMLSMGGHNKYNQEINPQLMQFTQQLQGNIKLSTYILDQMKETSDKLISQMHNEKKTYLQTLLLGEKEGHCRGIKKRVDPTIRYKLQQQLIKQKQIYDEQRIKAAMKKKLKDHQNIIDKRNRIKERLVKIGFQEDKKKENKKQVQSASPLRVVQPIPNTKLNVKKKESDTCSFDGDSTQQEVPQFHKMRTMIADQQTALDKIQLIRNSVSPTNKNHEGHQLKFMIKEHMKNAFTKQMPLSKNTNIGSAKIQSSNFLASKKNSAKNKLEAYGIKGITGTLAERLELKFRQHDSVLALVVHSLLANFKRPGSASSVGKKHKHILLSDYTQLGLFDNQAMQAFFKRMSDEDSIKSGRLKRAAFKDFLTDRYSQPIGEKMLAFMENNFNSLYQIDYASFLQVITDLLNQGPKCYQKFVFACISQSNPGLICEHDMFAILEYFKDKDPTLFVKELINMKDVPRNINTLVDDSDQTFFDAFQPDVSRVHQLILLHKEIGGTEKSEPSISQKHHQQDISPTNQTPDQKQSQRALEVIMDKQIKVIEYIIDKIVSKAPPAFHPQIVEILIESDSLESCKQSLIEFCKGKINLEVKPSAPTKTNNKSTRPDDNQGTQNTGLFKVPSKVNFCMLAGDKTKIKNKNQQKCIQITFEDFKKFISFKQNVSSILTDFLLQITGGQLNLDIFESDVSKYRNPANGDLPGPLVVKSGVTTYLQPNSKNSLAQPKSLFRQKTSIDGELADANKPRGLVKHHIITCLMQIKNSRSLNGDREFNGKMICKPSVRQSSFNNTFKKLELQNEEAQTSKLFIIDLDQTTKLYSFRFYFGLENFLHIFMIFYFMAKIPEDAENNPFAIYIDKKSCLKNFKHVFGIDNLEIATRFFILLSEPEDKKFTPHVGILRWFYICSKICFRFYDYDHNEFIGSVDIINIIKNLDHAMVIKLEAKYKLIEAQRDFLHKAHKEGKLRKALGMIDFVLHDDQVDSDSDNQSEASDQSDKVKPLKKGRDGNFQLTQPISALLQDGEFDQEEEVEEIIQDYVASQKKKREGIVVQEELQISNIWNQFLFESQMLRNYYLENAAFTSPGSTQSNFLNRFVYIHKFLPSMKKRFQHCDFMKQPPTIKTPAILHFFRSKLMKSEQVNDGKGPIHLLDLNNEKFKHLDKLLDNLILDQSTLSNRFFDQFRKLLNNEKHPMTIELSEMLVSLIRLSTVPVHVTPYTLEIMWENQAGQTFDV